MVCDGKKIKMEATQNKHNPDHWQDKIWQYYPINYDPLEYHKLTSWWLDKVTGDLQPILEIGCHSSLALIYLKYKYPEKTVVGIDINPFVVHYAKTRVYFFGLDIPIYVDDGFNINAKDKEYGIAFSEGLAEHFDEEDRIKLLKEHLRVAKYVLMMVPTKEGYIPNTGYGDERWEDKEYWSKFMNDNFIVKEEFDQFGHYGCILEGVK